MTRTVLLVLAMVAVAAAQETADDTPVPVGRGSAPSTSFLPDPRFPTAGTVLGTFAMPTSPSSATFGMEYDLIRSRMLLGEQYPTAAPNPPVPPPGTPTIYVMDPLTLAVTATYSIINPTCPIGGARAFTFQVNGITVTRNGNYVIDDFNGDLATLDDCAAEFNPVTGLIVNAWRLDSASCPASCPANTNTNVPQVSQAAVREVTNIDSDTSDPGPAQTFLFTQSPVAGPPVANFWVSVVQFTPGCPGTWFRRNTFVATGANSPAGMDWDQQLQSLWLIDRNSSGIGNRIYEYKYNRGTNTVSTVQGWPSPAADFSIAVGVVDDHNVPVHQVWGCATANSKMIRYDSGHAPLYYIPSPGGPGSGAVSIQIRGDPQDNNNAYISAVSLAPAPLGLSIGNNRLLFANPDALFLLTLSLPNAPPLYSGFQGALTVGGTPTPINPPIGTIAITVPPLSGTTLALVTVVLEGPPGGTSVNGISGYGPPFTVALP